MRIRQYGVDFVTPLEFTMDDLMSPPLGQINFPPRGSPIKMD